MSIGLVALALCACTPAIPFKDDFGTSALVPIGDIPPEFAEFNNLDPAVNDLVATQMCATPYQLREAKTLAASSGRMVQAIGRCQTHIPIIGP
ncbi:MAG: hypothetical protein ACM3JG_07240 [Thiohalocapsa sp.]